MTENKIQTILLIFSDKEKLAQVKNIFPADQFNVILSNSGEESISLLKKITPSLIVLEVAQNGMDGIETCQIIRKEMNIVDPVIIFLTDINDDYTQIAAYEAGADDYIPFAVKPRLFRSKVNTLLHRKHLCCPADEKAVAGQLIIDRNKFLVNYLDRDFILPKKEFLLLEALAGVKGDVVNREQLINMVWNDRINIDNKTIDVHIRKIREKISTDIIRTIKGVGYQLNVGVILK